MTHSNLDSTNNEQWWRWIIFPFKAYVIAVPLALLLSQFCGYLFHHHHGQDANIFAYEERRMEIRVMENQTVSTFKLLEIGYAMCLAMLVVEATVSARIRNRKRLRSAIVFSALVLVSMVVVYSGMLWPVNLGWW